MKKIIEECRKAMYDAVWQEIDRDPQRPATTTASGWRKPLRVVLTIKT